MSTIHILKYPTGRFGFVGKVPSALAFDNAHPDDLRSAKVAGTRIARMAAERAGRQLVTRSFETEADARKAAVAEGFGHLLSDTPA